MSTRRSPKCEPNIWHPQVPGKPAHYDDQTILSGQVRYGGHQEDPLPLLLGAQPLFSLKWPHNCGAEVVARTARRRGLHGVWPPIHGPVLRSDSVGGQAGLRAGATYSAVSSMSTDELHERLTHPTGLLG
jgi:hypothetical protein